MPGWDLQNESGEPAKKIFPEQIHRALPQSYGFPSVEALFTEWFHRALFGTQNGNPVF